MHAFIINRQASSVVVTGGILGCLMVKRSAQSESHPSACFIVFDLITRGAVSLLPLCRLSRFFGPAAWILYSGKKISIIEPPLSVLQMTSRFTTVFRTLAGLVMLGRTANSVDAA